MASSPLRRALTHAQMSKWLLCCLRPAAQELASPLEPDKRHSVYTELPAWSKLTTSDAATQDISPEDRSAPDVSQVILCES